LVALLLGLAFGADLQDTRWAFYEAPEGRALRAVCPSTPRMGVVRTARSPYIEIVDQLPKADGDAWLFSAPAARWLALPVECYVEIAQPDPPPPPDEFGDLDFKEWLENAQTDDFATAIAGTGSDQTMRALGPVHPLGKKGKEQAAGTEWVVHGPARVILHAVALPAVPEMCLTIDSVKSCGDASQMLKLDLVNGRLRPHEGAEGRKVTWQMYLPKGKHKLSLDQNAFVRGYRYDPQALTVFGKLPKTLGLVAPKAAEPSEELARTQPLGPEIKATPILRPGGEGGTHWAPAESVDAPLWDERREALVGEGPCAIEFEDGSVWEAADPSRLTRLTGLTSGPVRADGCSVFVPAATGQRLSWTDPLEGTRSWRVSRGRVRGWSQTPISQWILRRDGVQEVHDVVALGRPADIGLDGQLWYGPFSFPIPEGTGQLDVVSDTAVAVRVEGPVEPTKEEETGWTWRDVFAEVKEPVARPIGLQWLPASSPESAREHAGAGDWLSAMLEEPNPSLALPLALRAAREQGFDDQTSLAAYRVLVLGAEDIADPTWGAIRAWSRWRRAHGLYPARKVRRMARAAADGWVQVGRGMSLRVGPGPVEARCSEGCELRAIEADGRVGPVWQIPGTESVTIEVPEGTWFLQGPDDESVEVRAPGTHALFSTWESPGSNRATIDVIGPTAVRVRVRECGDCGRLEGPEGDVEMATLETGGAEGVVSVPKGSHRIVLHGMSELDVQIDVRAPRRAAVEPSLHRRLKEWSPLPSPMPPAPSDLYISEAVWRPGRVALLPEATTQVSFSPEWEVYQDISFESRPSSLPIWIHQGFQVGGSKDEPWLKNQGTAELWIPGAPVRGWGTVRYEIGKGLADPSVSLKTSYKGAIIMRLRRGSEARVTADLRAAWGWNTENAPSQVWSTWTSQHALHLRLRPEYRYYISGRWRVRVKSDIYTNSPTDPQPIDRANALVDVRLAVPHFWVQGESGWEFRFKDAYRTEFEHSLKVTGRAHGAVWPANGVLLRGDVAISWWPWWKDWQFVASIAIALPQRANLVDQANSRTDVRWVDVFGERLN